ncbi:MAG: hypothetical protein ACYDCH_09625 [Gaiellaceae bacterium]
MNPNSSAARSLDDRLDTTAEAWKPNAGDKIVGEVIDVDSRDGGFGLYPIVVLRTDAGDEYAVHGFHTVIRNELAKRPPRIGERLGIKYLGKSDKGYEAYKIVFETAAAVDWQQIADEVDPADLAAIEAGDPGPEVDVSADDDIPF